MKKRSSKLLLLASLLFFPTVVLAANIAQHPTGAILNDEKSLFRYRDIPGLWQRSPIDQTAINDLVVVDDQVYATTQSVDTYHLLKSPNGLSYTVLWQSTDPILLAADTFAVTSNKVAILEKNKFLEYSLPANSQPNAQDNIFMLSPNHPGFITITVNGVEIFDLATSSINPQWEYQCSQSGFFRDPQPVIACDDTVIIFNAGQPELLLESVQLVSSSSQAHLFKHLVGAIYTIYDGEQLVSLDFSELETGDELSVIGNRLFWSKTTGLFEVNWLSDPVVISQLPADGSLKITDKGKRVILDDLTQLYYSREFGSWVTTNIIGNFDLLQTSQGLIAYTLEDSDAYYEQDPGNFLEMDSSWAASAKIRTIRELGAKLLLVLRNSSNNPNIYESTDYHSWKRLTMPSQPTYVVDVTQARNLPADTMVEVNAKISVLPNIVGSGIGYLADELAGIQFFLSSSKGELDLAKYTSATAIGKISSSQVGRIILDSKLSIIIGAKFTPHNKLVSISLAKKQLAKTVLLKGKISSLSTDSATLTDGTGEIKFHQDAIKNVFQNTDEVQVEAVVDYNSSSEAVEAWSIGEPAKLISRVSEPPTPLNTVTTPTTVNNQGFLPATTVTTNVPSSSPQTIVQPTTTDTPKVSGVTDNNSLPSSVTFLAGLLAGGLVVRGSRFSKYFISS